MPGQDGPGTAGGSWRGPGRRRRILARSLSGVLRPRPGEPMRVDDLPAGGLAHPNVALHAAIRRAGGGEVLLASRVTRGAEIGPLHGAEAEAVLVVVTRRAQTTAELARRRVTHEAPALAGGDGEALPAERPSGGPVVIESAPLATGEVLAGQRLLVLRLVAAAALAVPDGLGEVRMAAGRVALPAADALRGVKALGIVGRHRGRMTGLAPLDVRGGPGDGRHRIGSRGRPRREEATGDRERDRRREQAPRQPAGRGTSLHAEEGRFWPSTALAAATTWSGSKPNRFWSSLRGAEAPKVFMPMTCPHEPT